MIHLLKYSFAHYQAMVRLYLWKSQSTSRVRLVPGINTIGSRQSKLKKTCSENSKMLCVAPCILCNIVFEAVAVAFFKSEELLNSASFGIKIEHTGSPSHNQRRRHRAERCVGRRLLAHAAGLFRGSLATHHWSHITKRHQLFPFSFSPPFLLLLNAMPSWCFGY